MLLPGYVNGGGRAYGYDSLACLSGLTNPSDPTDWRVVAVLDGDRVHQGCCRGDTWRLHGLLVQHSAGWREHRFRRFARVAREFGYVGSFNGWDGFGFAVAGRRLPAAGNVGLLFRYDGVQRLSGLWHDHQAPLARPTDSLVFLESEDASGLAVAGFFDTWHSGSLDGLLASMMNRGQDTWPLPIELFGCLTTLAEHPDGNEGGAARTPSVDRFIMGQASHARGNDRYPTRIAGAGGSQWSMAMSGPGCSSMDANRQLPVSVPACATGTMIRVVTDSAMTPGSIAVDEMNVVAVVLLSDTSIALYRDDNGKGVAPGRRRTVRHSKHGIDTGAA